MIDFNVLDNKGVTCLHNAVDAQDYEMFNILVSDPYIDVFKVDIFEFNKPRYLSVIFSAFHKILYKMEKIKMRKLFQQNIRDHYTDYKSSKMSISLASSSSPVPISVSNKTKKRFNLMNHSPKQSNPSDFYKQA